MTTREYLKQKARRDKQAELQFQVRIKKALLESVQGIIDESANIMGLEARIDTLFRSQPIYDALRWLYVEWGFKQLVWFRKSMPFGKKENYDLWLQKLDYLFRTTGAEKVTEIANVTKELAKPIIKEAIAYATQGKSVDFIKDYIFNAFEEAGGVMSDGRARTIARTEVISASNQASYEAVKSTGLQVEKKWVTGGLNIRPTHLNAESQGWIPFDEKFKVGAYNMSHPGDPSGGAEEVINCKCVLIYRTID